MSQLHLAVLGPPQVHHGSQPLSFSTRKELALLVYLAVEPKSHSRKRLIALLWPESDAARGSAAFRSTLLRLRDALGEHSTQEDAHLEADRTTLALDQRQLSFDLHTLDAAYSQAEQLSTHSLASATVEQQAAIEELERVSRLVRGPFLQDFMLHEASPFEEWARAQREYWQVRLCSFFDRLARVQEELGAYNRAIESIRRGLSVDPLHEDGCLHLMRLYERQGNRRAALEAYEACRALLESELHALPSPQLTVLAERLRRGMPAVRSSPSNGPGTPPSALTLLQTPLIGRDQEFARLVETYTGVQAAQGTARTQVVLVEGEAGIGKTRLVSEFVTWTRTHEAEVLAGRAFEMGGRLPYQPLISALRPRLDEENAPDDLLADVWLSALARILPELRERYPDLPTPTSEETVAQTQLFEAVARLIAAWARHKPVVLWLDDLHWADAASLDLLVYLIASWQERATSVLLLLSLRGEEEHSPSLLEWKANLSHSITPTQLRLSSFSMSETQQLVQALSGGTNSASSEQIGTWLYRETAGHPFYLLETLKLLLERRLLLPIYVPQQGWMLDFARLRERAHLQQEMLPTSVRDLIRARLSRLTQQAQALLLAAAVLAHFSTFEHLAMLTGLSETEVLSGFDELIAQRFLLESQAEREGVVESVYVFTHDKLREVVYQEANEARRRIFHRRAFELLQQAGAPAADLAHQGGRAGLAEANFRYHIQAGDEAMSMFAMHDAVTYYEQARRVLLSVQTSTAAPSFVPTSDIMYLLLQLGRAYELLQQWDHAQQTYEALHLAAGQTHDEYLCAVALNRQVQALARDDAHLPRVRTLLLEARRAAIACGDEALLKETMWNEYQQGGAAWDQIALNAWGEHKAKRMQEVQNWLLVAQRLTGFAYDNPQMTQWERAHTSITQMITWYQQQGATDMEGYARNVLAGACIQQDEVRAANTALRQSQALCLQCGSEYGWVVSSGALAYALLLEADYEESWELAHETVVRARHVGFLPLLEEDLFILGDIAMVFGQWEPARQWYQEGLMLSERLAVRGDIELHAARLCMISVLQGDWSRALLYAQQAQAAREEHVLPFPLAPAWYEIEALLWAGKREQAEQEIARLERRLGANRRHRISLLRSRAILAQHDGELAEAVSLLDEALHLAQAIGLPGDEWQLQAARGDLFESMGNIGQAQHAFAYATEKVRTLAEKIGDTSLRSSFLNSPPVRHILQREQALPHMVKHA